MDDKYDSRMVIEDARHRHAAVVALINSLDTRAMSLLRLYVTIGVAAAAGAVGLLAADAPSLPSPVGWALSAVVPCRGLGSYWCFRVMRTTPINLPGRGADFWLWALRPDVPTDMALQAYLNNLQAKGLQNDALGARMTLTLECAKWAGMLSPFAALVAGVAAAAMLGH